MDNQTDRYQDFLCTHRVFNTDELMRQFSISGYQTKILLTKLVQKRRIRKLRNCLYTVLPEYADEHFVPPALLMAAKMASDAVLGYGSALDFYGMSRNLLFLVPFLSRRRLSKSRSGNITFQPCLPPKTLQGNDHFGVEEHSLWETGVRVVGKERLLVDLLDRLDLSGGWETITNGFQYESSLEFSKLLEYLHLLNHPATSARVGFFLQQFQKIMNVPEDTLLEIECLKPKNAEHFYRARRYGKLEKRWNLYVPEELYTSAEDNYEF